MSQRSGSTPEDPGARRVLVVDDDVDFAEALVEILRSRGYECLVAHDAGQACQAARSFPADVALLDIRLGQGSGIGLIDELRRSRPHILCLMITAYAAVDTAVEALQKGAYDYLEKPVPGPVLLATLERCFEVVHLQAANARNEAALRESERRYRTLASLSPVGIFCTDASGTCTYVNERWSDISGLAREAALGRSWTESVYPDDRERVETEWHHAAVARLPFRSEFRLLRADGAMRWVLGQAVADSADNNSGTGFIGTLTDITDRKRAEQDRARMESQLRHAQKMESMGTLAGGVAHDFNNALTALLGYTGIARRSVPANHEVLTALDGIEQVADQASGMVRSLLTFSREADVQKAAVDLGRLVQETARMLRHMLPATVEVLTEVQTPEELWVEGNTIQLQQALMNLAINARDAMPEGGCLRIVLEHQAADAADVLSAVVTRGRGAALLRIEDTGAGMSDEVLARVFDPFFTTKPREEGTGMGMAVVHGVVVGHQGHIRVDSRPGLGTSVVITLPCCDPPPRAAAPPRGPERERGGGEILLLAEDNRQVRAIIAGSRSSAGYKVVQAGDGVEALQAFELNASRVHLAILDIDLPRMDGVSCLHHIRQARPGFPAVVISGLLDVYRTEGCPADVTYLQKPFQMSELVSVVRRRLAETRNHAGRPNTPG